MVRVLSIILFSLFAQSALALTQVTATVDKNPVTIKESFILTVTADDDVDSSALDTAPLLENFIVGRTSVSTQTSIVNFQTSRTTKWQTVLIPKRTGSIMLPPLTVEGHKTAPITLTVLSASDPQATSQRDVFITAAVSNNEVYVQQMLTLTVKLHFAAELKRGSLTEPELSGAAIAQVGNDKESETIINGRRYRVIERTFSVTPQESGEFMLRSPMFSGEIMVQSARRSNFLSFGETKAISVLGDEVPITVKAQPAHFQGHWLPSELLSLHQEWQPSGNEFNVGEPITHTITMTAVGVSEEQLPEINLNLPEGLKVYPDQQTTHSTVTNGRFVSQSVNNFAIVASKAGQYTLPAVEISWWNTVTNRIETSTLPEQSVTILPGAQPKQVPSATSQVNSPAAVPNNAINAPIIVEQPSIWQWLFLALWLITLSLWIAREIIWRRASVSTPAIDSNKVDNIQLAIMAASKKQQGKQVLALLVPWFNDAVTNKHFNSIADIKAYCNDQALADEIDKLQALYFGKNVSADEQPNWDGQALVAALKRFRQQLNSKHDATLRSLNP